MRSKDEIRGIYLIERREVSNEDSTITQDTMLRHHIANLNRRVLEYKESFMKDY